MTKDEEIEGIATAAVQLSQYLFMHLVDRNIIDPTEANQWLEQGIKLTLKEPSRIRRRRRFLSFFAKACGGPGRRLPAYEISCATSTASRRTKPRSSRCSASSTAMSATSRRCRECFRIIRLRWSANTDTGSEMVLMR